jgi:NOL1/NOP2/fmu family ribosome biogenesis protein
MKPDEKIKILEGKELENFTQILNDQFGITKIPGQLIMKGKEKVFLYTGNLPEKDLKTIEFRIFIERVGTYVAKIEEQGIRLSIEGSQIFKNQITKNIVELNEEEMLTWMHGSEVLKQSRITGFVIIKYKEDMLGTGKASAEKITNFIPKSRRLKHKQN